MKKAFVYVLIVSFLFIVVSLCSISVMYQADRIGKENEFATVSGVSYGELFFQTILFSTLAIAAFISFLHTTITTKRLYGGGGVQTGGMLPATIVAFIGAFVFLITSFISLGNLVMPPSDGDTIQFSSVGAASADVIIHIALTTIALSYAMIVRGLFSSVQTIRQSSALSVFTPPAVPVMMPVSVPPAANPPQTVPAVTNEPAPEEPAAPAPAGSPAASDPSEASSPSSLS